MKLPRIKAISIRMPMRNELLHKSHTGIHSVYFGLVFLEGHGLYAFTGGVLCMLTILNWFLHYD